MRTWSNLAVTLAAMVLAAGCRSATRVVEVPRVDLQVEGSGNRGFLVGTPPPAPTLKSTRKVLETEIEIPGWSSEPPDVSSGEAAASGPGAVVVIRPDSDYEEYVVRPGETLWSIAAQPEIYGTATSWRRIYDANRVLLDRPDDLQAGMRLRIPRWTLAGEEDDPGAFKK